MDGAEKLYSREQLEAKQDASDNYLKYRFRKKNGVPVDGCSWMIITSPHDTILFNKNITGV